MARRDGRWRVPDQAYAWAYAQAAADRVLLHEPARGQQKILPRAEFAALWSGRLILMATRETIAGQRRKFDATWFIPAMVRFRRLFGTVLVASLAMQMLMLVGPLFMQVVIDKVLVHRAWNTLDVLVLGLLAVVVCEIGLSALRTWLFAHTTNRVDVELGSRLYDHLIHLPLAYFGVRRVGQSVARVREIETIRRFLTGNALTLIVDLLFTVVFFAIMFFYSVQLSLIVLAAVPLFAGIVLAISPVLRSRIEEKFKRGAENQAFLVESVSGIETVKSLATEPVMKRRWEEQLAGYVGADFRVASLANIGSHAIQLVAKLVTAAILWFGAHLVIEGGLTVGQFVAFNSVALSPVERG